MRNTHSFTRRSVLWSTATASLRGAQSTPNASTADARTFAFISDFWKPHDNAILQSLELSRGARVLDAGCGRGDHIILFAQQGAHVRGVDIRPEAVEFARERIGRAGLAARAEAVVADLRRLEFARGEYDLIWSSHVFHGIADPDAVARTLVMGLKKGGRLALRENRIPSALLPADIGDGHPGLESRLQQAFDTWFQTDRQQRGAYPHGWIRPLREAGLGGIRVRSYVYQVGPDFTGTQRNYLKYWLARKADTQGVDPRDAQTVQEITNPDSPRFFLKRYDLTFTAVSTVYIGTRLR